MAVTAGVSLVLSNAVCWFYHILNHHGFDEFVVDDLKSGLSLGVAFCSGGVFSIVGRAASRY